MNYFGIHVEKLCANIAKNPLRISLQFSTSYLCKLGFSTIILNIKTTKGKKLEFIKEEMWYIAFRKLDREKRIYVKIVKLKSYYPLNLYSVYV